MENGEEGDDQTVPKEEGPFGDPIECPRGERDAHLRDCDDEIFDDEDFYHRVSLGRGVDAGRTY